MRSCSPIMAVHHLCDRAGTQSRQYRSTFLSSDAPLTFIDSLICKRLQSIIAAEQSRRSEDGEASGGDKERDAQRDMNAAEEIWIRE